MTGRLLAGYLALAAAVLLALEIPLGVIYGRNERQALQARIERDAVALATMAEDGLEAGRVPPGMRAVVRRYTRTTGARAVVIARDGTLLLDSDATRPEGRAFGNRPEVAAALSGRPTAGERRSTTLGTRIMYVAVPVASGGRVHGAVRVSFAAHALTDRVHRYWLTLIAIGAVVLSSVALIGWLLARSVAAPLADLGVAADRAGDGDLSVRADETRGPPEVRQLARRLNTANARLEALVAAHRDFVGDASHQLRTPLTALRLRLENVERDVAPEGRDDVEAALAEADRLDRLVDGLLTLVRAERVAQDRHTVDVGAVARERVAGWVPLADEEGIALHTDIPDGPSPGLVVPGALEQMIDNLVDNAVQASGDGGEVTVGVVGQGRWVLVSVADRGPGMSPSDMASAFERFWTTRGRHGTGLGLAIVQGLAEAGGGDARLRARDGGGLVAEVRIPVA